MGGLQVRQEKNKFFISAFSQELDADAIRGDKISILCNIFLYVTR